jgi:ADP-ribose pyrophosphatase
MAAEPEVLLVTQRFKVVRHTQTDTDGRVHIRETVQHPGAVTVLPILTDGQICLIRNHRVAVNRTLIELPAGTLEVGEDPRHTAERELIEETGYRAKKMERLTEFFMSPGILNERMHLFVATGLEPGPTAREAGEEIENLIVPWQEAIQMALDGTIQDAKTLVGLLFYDHRLRSGTEANRL